MLDNLPTFDQTPHFDDALSKELNSDSVTDWLIHYQKRADQNGYMDLNQVYQQALQQSDLYQSQRLQMKRDTQSHKISFGAFLPHVDLQANITGLRAEQLDLGASGNVTTRSAGLDVSQTLFDYHDYAAYWSDLASDQASHRKWEGQQLDFIYNVAKAYFGVLNAYDQAMFAKQNTQAASSTLHETQLRESSGLATQPDVQIAKSGYYQALANYRQASNTIQQAFFDLYRYTGEIDQAFMPLKADLDFQLPAQKRSQQEWIQVALQNNPMIQQRQREKQSAYYDRQNTLANFMPAFNLKAGYAYHDNTVDSIIAPYVNQVEGSFGSGYVRLEVQWNIFQGGAHFAQQKQSASQYMASNYDLIQQKRQVRQAIVSDYTSIESTIGQIDAFQQAVKSAEIAYKQALSRYKVGMVVIRQVLDQQKRLYEAASQLADAKYQYILSVLKLKQDAGVLSQQDITYFNHWLKQEAS